MIGPTDFQIILGKVRPLSRPHAKAHPQVLIIALCGLVIVGVRLYRNQKERGGESDRFSAELSEAVWPSTQYPEANAKLASTLRSTKPRDLAATIAAELDRR